MAFFGRYIHDLIQSVMEDPERRLKGTEEDIRKVQKHADKIKTMYRAPLVPWGFWRSPVATAKLHDRDANPQVQRLPGHSKTWYRD